MKGFAQKAPQTDVTHALFDSMVVNTTADPSDSDFIVSVVNEYFPLHKIRTVASDATAFPSRGEQNNVLIVASWTSGDVKERTERARKIARELGGIIDQGGRGYGRQRESWICQLWCMYKLHTKSSER